MGFKKVSPNLTEKLVGGVQSVGSFVIDKGKEVYETGKEDKELYEQIKRDNADAEQRMDRSIEDYGTTCLTLKNEFEYLEKVTDEIRDSFKGIGISLAACPQEDLSAQNPEIKDAVMAESILNGVAVGSLAAGSAVLLTASFGTAGTGAAISGLTGTYALNATLAALGGGTLASGGFGIAGGIAVASALFIVPTIVIGAALAHNKIRELERKTKQTVEQVNHAIELNRQLGERNLIAAEKIRALYDLGTNIKFLLHAIRQRFSYDHKVMAAVQDKLGKAFFAIEIFQGREIHPELDAIIQEIESDVLFLSEAFFEQKNEQKEKYSEKEINDVFPKLYQDAEEYLYLSYPWYGEEYVDKDLPKLKEAAARGVRILICYGIGKIDNNDERQVNTQVEIDKIRRALPSNVKIVRIDSHMKIAVCEKYVLYGSQNMMSYRYQAGKRDIRSEITIKDTDAQEIEEFKKIIEREAGKRVRLRW